MTSLRSLCHASKLISKLDKNNYFFHNDNNDDILVDNTTLSTILQSLDIYESTNDVIILLTTSNSRTNTDKFSIERTLTMCDELCVPAKISSILRQCIRLNNVMDDHIINFKDTSIGRCIRIYNNGYRIIINNNIGRGDTIIWKIPAINNASHNGLFIRSIDTSYMMLMFYDTKLLQNITNDIINIRCDDYDILQSRNNAEIIYSSQRVMNLKELSFAKNIKKLHVVRITDSDLESFTNLRELNLDCNKYVTSCNQIADTLWILDANRSIISDIGIYMCRKIKKLDASFNINITTCAPFAHSLIILDAVYSGITDAGLKCCTRIKVLDASYCSKITTCEPFAKTLKSLKINCTMSAQSGMTDQGLKRCTQIRFLHFYENPNINTISGFPLLKRLVYNTINPHIKEELKSRKHIIVMTGY